MATTLRITQMPKLEVLNSDIVLEVVTDGEKTGELHISKGSLDYYPANSKKKHYRVSWTKLAEILEEHGNERT
ncbi:hypothetical protein D3869_09955 [Azospirillum brasilense]|uniref:Uncharacterized protein n=1 Tax=Azospirillum brasilense TaxID=192 RepID=A0A4D8R492_AZOBR|nr:hypothetical protein [Azospirillum brasilense]QCO15526.1 hypothetical protein D3869_09955 [Azospirillum brasilense]